MSRARAGTSRSSRGNFTGFDEAPRPPWSRLAAEELEPRLNDPTDKSRCRIAASSKGSSLPAWRGASATSSNKPCTWSPSRLQRLGCAGAPM